MGWIQDRAAQADAMYRALLAPLLAPNEPLLGAFLATHSKALSNKQYVIGVMPQRIVMQHVDRKLQPAARPVFVTSGEITKSSIDGWGGGWQHFIASNPGELRFETANDKYKLMALGGGLDQALTGEGQLQGKTAFIQFLAAARGVR